MKERIEPLHRELLSKAMEVTEIFNDFYGEDRVELQGVVSLSDFTQLLHTTPMITIVGAASLLRRSEYFLNNQNKREVIEAYESFRDNDHTKKLIDSEEIFDKYAPFMFEFIGNKWFKSMDIITHFPKVTITNEYGDSVEVENLWTKTPVTWMGQGKGWFRMNRSTYEASHMEADYMHSHVAGIPWSGFDEFQSVCTGSGPINSTLGSLATSFDAAIWQLYCLELERYVATESISGGPYRRMKDIGRDSSSLRKFFKKRDALGIGGSVYTSEMKKEFLEYILKSGKLKFNYVKGSYGLATPFADTVMIISNLFIEYFNKRYGEVTGMPSRERLKDYGIIKEAIISNGCIYDPRSTSGRNFREYVGKHVLTFKDKDITLEVKGLTDRPTNTFTILNIDIIGEYVWSILNLLNCEYGNSKKTKAGVNQETTRFSI